MLLTSLWILKTLMFYRLAGNIMPPHILPNRESRSGRPSESNSWQTGLLSLHPYSLILTHIGPRISLWDPYTEGIFNIYLGLYFLEKTLLKTYLHSYYTYLKIKGVTLPFLVPCWVRCLQRPSSSHSLRSPRALLCPANTHQVLPKHNEFPVGLHLSGRKFIKFLTLEVLIS